MGLEPDPFIDGNLNWVLDQDPINKSEPKKQVTNAIFYGSKSLNNKREFDTYFHP